MTLAISSTPLQQEKKKNTKTQKTKKIRGAAGC